MKIEYMVSVLAVAKYSSFKKAAEAIPCACSTVTKHVKNVEEELDTVLFSRTANNTKVELTPKGVRVVSCFREITECYQKLQDSLAQERKEKRKRIRIGIDGSYWGAAAISNLRFDFYKQYPEIQLTVVKYDGGEWQELLRNKDIDGAFLITKTPGCGTCKMWTGELADAVFVGKNRVALMTAKDEPRFQKKECCLKDLRTEKFLFGKSLSEQMEERNENINYSLHGYFAKACFEQGFTPNIVKINTEIRDTYLADLKESLVAERKGVSLTMVPEKFRDHRELRYMTISDYSNEVNYYIVKRRDIKTETLEKFTDYLKKVLCQEDDGQ